MEDKSKSVCGENPLEIHSKNPGEDTTDKVLMLWTGVCGWGVLRASVVLLENLVVKICHLYWRQREKHRKSEGHIELQPSQYLTSWQIMAFVWLKDWKVWFVKVCKSWDIFLFSEQEINKMKALWLNNEWVSPETVIFYLKSNVFYVENTFQVAYSDVLAECHV